MGPVETDSLSTGASSKNHKEKFWRNGNWSLESSLFGLALAAVPASIALSETLLTTALALRLVAIGRRRAEFRMPPVFWLWALWAALEVCAWFSSPDIGIGFGEIRHLLLIAALFVLLPSLDSATKCVTVWRGIVGAATLSSLVLAGQFVWREVSHPPGVDSVVYLRGGGLLHHWMVYGTVEILVFAGLLELWHFFPEERWWMRPVLVIHGLAIVLSLTRMLWICCLLILAAHLAWRRSRWVWMVPAIPCLLFLLAPGAVKSRITDSLQPDYYSNSERLQMIDVGWRMILDKPLTGVGPGRVNQVYAQYLMPGDLLPAYHGHLHNNLIQLAAECGLPVACAAVLFVAVLFRALWRRYRFAVGRSDQFLCRTSMLGLMGFLASGMCDYTYGHSLGLILVSFVILPPLMPGRTFPDATAGHS